MNLPADIEPWRLFWAKTDRHNNYEKHGKDWTHPLWAHLIDVACVAEALWKPMVPISLKQALREAAGLDEPAHVLSLWIGLHDIGKAIPGFQYQHDSSWEMLEKHGMGIVAPQNLLHHHGFASVPILCDWLDTAGISENGETLLGPMALFIGFHHGRLCKKDDLKGPTGALGDELWETARRKLVNTVVETWHVKQWPAPPNKPEPWPPWLLGFAGWVTLADWVGSMTDRFVEAVSGKVADLDPPAYVRSSRDVAERLVQRLGFGDTARIVEHAPERLFNFSDLRAIQQHVCELPVSDTPTLTIVEAPTGEGKTEAAFALAAKQQAQRDGGGLYVAMPTMATSNGLFHRFLRFVKKAQDPKTLTNVMLVHGTADLNRTFQKVRAGDYQELLNNVPKPSEVSGNDDDRDSGPAGHVQALRWFLPKKRGLLAPYGVGTVDQALLGVLFSKHFFLRLFGLSGKTIIFDEVHAYDTYMSELFERLLRWLRVLDVNVILLSATLPTATRARLLEAWDASEEEAARETKYPAVWHVYEGQCGLQDGFKTHMEEETPEGRTIHLDWITSDRENFDGVLTEVHRAVEANAAIAVIVNQVDRAQTIYQALTTGPDALDLPAEDLHLLHARFPLDERYDREEAALKRFSKQEDGTLRPPGPAVLVATQVAEQSLDLDFDVMLSDLAPIDLLLQRAGRVHRHSAIERPAGCEEPRLFLLCPDPDESGLPNVNEVAYVYDTLTVLRTWHLLQGYETWTLPWDYRALVDGVYVPGMHQPKHIPDDLLREGRRTWQSAQRAHRNEEKQQRGVAKKRVIRRPDDLKNLLRQAPPLLHEDENPDIHEDLKALTRSGKPSINIICLYQIDGTYYLGSNKEAKAPLDRLDEPDAIRELLKRSVRMSRDEVFRHFKDWQPEWWRKIVKDAPALYFYRPMVFEPETRHGEDGEEETVWVYRVKGTRLSVQLDPMLGLVYEGPEGS